MNHKKVNSHLFNPFKLQDYDWVYISCIARPYLKVMWYLGTGAWFWGISERITTTWSNDGYISGYEMGIITIAILTFMTWLFMFLLFIETKPLKELRTNDEHGFDKRP